MPNIPEIKARYEAATEQESFATKAQSARDCEGVAPKSRKAYWGGIAAAYEEAAALDELARTDIPQLVMALEEAQGKLDAVANLPVTHERMPGAAPNTCYDTCVACALARILKGE